MSCLESMGMAPPNVMHRFAEEYFNWDQNNPPPDDNERIKRDIEEALEEAGINAVIVPPREAA